MHRFPLAAAMLAAVSLTAAPAIAQGMRSSMQSSHMAPRGSAAGGPSTSDFLVQAARSDRFEIEEGRAALKMSRSAEVKAFASRMIRDHTSSSAQIKAAAARAHIAMPPPPPLSPDQQRMLNSTQGMAKMGGFDADYINDQVMAHEQALALMSGYAAHGSSAALRDAAAKIVPVVRSHLAMAQAMQRKMPKGHMSNMGHMAPMKGNMRHK